MNYLTQATLNSCLTAVESGFNIAGYLPNIIKINMNNGKKTEKVELREAIAVSRMNFGAMMTITAVAITAIAYVANVVRPGYTDLHKKAIEYVGHGLLNIIRSAIEYKGFGALTLAYDLNGQKFMSYSQVNPQFDIQEKFFSYMKGQITRVDMTKVIPSITSRITNYVRSYF